LLRLQILLEAKL